MKLEQSPQLVMRQSLSMRLQQSARILQLSTEEVQSLVTDALQDNPLLDPDSAEPELTPDLRPTLLWDTATSKGRGAVLPDDPTAHWRAAPSRDQGLLENIQLSHADERCKALCALLVDALDDNGYLHDDYDALLPPDADHVSPGEWNAALALLQSLSSPGIGARSVEESLMLQLNARTDLDPRRRASVAALIQYELAELAHGSTAELTKRLQDPNPDFARAWEILQQLDPKPGRTWLPLQRHAIIPDVYVVKRAGKWTVIPDRHSLPIVEIEKRYARHLRQHAQEDAHASLRQALTEARWLSESLSMRRQTVCRVALHIVERQHLFFELGEQALQPMRISDLAEELGLHESTISRATANKYMDTPMGIFRFRDFFSGELDTRFGGSCSTSQVKAMIRALIQEEAPDAPLSDVTLHQRLSQDSIEISKRTVTKYRLQMDIPNAAARRRQAALKAIPRRT